MFSQADLLQIQGKGITIDQIKNQLITFEKGFPFLNVFKPAFAGDGIKILSDQEIQKYGNIYQTEKYAHTVSKFVPASGAATRMFKNLYEFLDNPQNNIEEVSRFLSGLKNFAFYSDLIEKASENQLNVENIDAKEIIKLLLFPEGLNYGNLPKGLIKFHRYNQSGRVPIEEHLVEGALYAVNSQNDISVHFTLSPEHISLFLNLINTVIEDYEKKYSVKFKITYSIQKPSTDTIAVDNYNKPFREKDGTLIFRPGGHGALLENLNEILSDIIFIKNIDNVVPDKLKPITVNYKNALAGLLLETQKQVAEYLNYLDSDEAVNNKKNNEIKTFIETTLGYRFSDNFLNLNMEDKRSAFFHILNRPIRVCGMVKNTGEPGGGPFWIKNTDGSLSLQILESSQFNLDDENIRQVYKSATHFNPVDLVVYIKDYKGNKFNLKRYTDPETGFISIKSKDGKELKALELPGLWNGAMANWNTLFVEVPLITFNPVKTVNDLLRAEHQQ